MSSATGAHVLRLLRRVLRRGGPPPGQSGAHRHSASTGVVYNAGGQSLFVFQNGREAPILSLDAENINLLSARPNDSGWLAITAQQSGYKGAVTVYNASHEPVITISLSSTFVVDAAVSPDCKTVAVVTMDQEGGVFHSKAAVLSRGQGGTQRPGLSGWSDGAGFGL